MSNVIIGCGAVGLSVAIALKNNRKYAKEEVIIIDKYNTPSKGTSLTNSGVMHAGLYYKKGSLKSILCKKGRNLLERWCIKNNLPINKCGKILVPFNKRDENRLNEIYKTAKSNGCKVQLIDYRDAKIIQPGITEKEYYLWSPQTYVFCPKTIINSFYYYLKNKNVIFITSEIGNINNDKKSIILKNGEVINFTRIFNCAGAGAINIAQKLTGKFNNLDVLPIMGEYGTQTSGTKIKTNLYPVPDPNLPFLGVHLTPRVSGEILVGPNAIPCIKQDIQGYQYTDIENFPKRISYHSQLLIGNQQNYREHAISELCLNVEKKFKSKSIQFLEYKEQGTFNLKMNRAIYGIRAQLINKVTNEFINDFMHEYIDGNMHVINAVSPAFTSCLALGEYLISKID